MAIGDCRSFGCAQDKFLISDFRFSIADFRKAKSKICNLQSTISNPPGQAIVLVVLLLPVFILLAAIAVDLYSLTTARTWAYRAASAAALRGASDGRDWDAYYATGLLRLDENVACEAALNTLAVEMARRGLAANLVDVRVLPDGGSIAGYPPEPRADQWGAGSWSSSRPAVGVYVSVPVTTTLLGLASGNVTELHVFAAAAIAR